MVSKTIFKDSRKVKRITNQVFLDKARFAGSVKVSRTTDANVSRTQGVCT